MNGPLMFGLLPFEKFGMLEDTRPPEQIIWEKDVTVRPEAGIFLIDGAVEFTEECEAMPSNSALIYKSN